jgi:Transglutaminase-like superfamily
MPQYLLAHHVFVCVQDEHVVFLDVRKDRYFALESAKTAGLGWLVPGWPIPAPPGLDFARRDAGSAAPALVQQVNRGALSGVVSLLLEKGILVLDAAGGKPAEVTVAEAPSRDLSDEDLDERPRVGPRLLSRFIASAIRARLLLKHRTFEAVIERVRDRTQRRPATRPRLVETELYGLVAAFSRLRPFFFSAKDACLFDALSLSEFLAGYGVFPRWVFGVQARPFGAHCWLQLNGVVLNDTVDHVKRYTPIMVV